MCNPPDSIETYFEVEHSSCYQDGGTAKSVGSTSLSHLTYFHGLQESNGQLLDLISSLAELKFDAESPDEQTWIDEWNYGKKAQPIGNGHVSPAKLVHVSLNRV